MFIQSNIHYVLHFKKLNIKLSSQVFSVNWHHPPTSTIPYLARSPSELPYVTYHTIVHSLVIAFTLNGAQCQLVSFIQFDVLKSNTPFFYCKLAQS